jgi:hypothetical protein
MKNIKNTVLALALFIISASSCKPEPAPVRQNTNYSVLLDLSDRLVNKDQSQKDIAAIQLIFAKFKADAAKDLYIGSRNIFQVRIIPQRYPVIDVSKFEGLLTLNLNTITVNQKAKAIVDFEKQLISNCNALYKTATVGNNPSDYFGVDIWAYLNDNSRSLTKVADVNNLYIITDGYFDFESSSHVLNKGNRYTNTQFMNSLKGLDWQQNARIKNMGLVPIKLSNNCSYTVVGIRSKSPNDPMEISKLKYFWSLWIKESANRSCSFVDNTSISAMSSQLNALK